jgi:hypothetical protein
MAAAQRLYVSIPSPFSFLFGARIQARAFCMLGEFSNTELYPQSHIGSWYWKTMGVLKKSVFSV